MHWKMLELQIPWHTFVMCGHQIENIFEIGTMVSKLWQKLQWSSYSMVDSTAIPDQASWLSTNSEPAQWSHHIPMTYKLRNIPYSLEINILYTIMLPAK